MERDRAIVLRRQCAYAALSLAT